MTLIDNHGGKDDCYVYESSYKMVVGPGQAKLIIIEVSALGYSLGSSKKAGFEQRWGQCFVYLKVWNQINANKV